MRGTSTTELTAGAGRPTSGGPTGANYQGPRGQPRRQSSRRPLTTHGALDLRLLLAASGNPSYLGATAPIPPPRSLRLRPGTHPVRGGVAHLV